MSGNGGRDAPDRGLIAALHAKWDGLPGRIAPHIALADVRAVLAEQGWAGEATLKAEALREAADLLVAECSTVAAPCFCSSAPWLRDRADALTRPTPPGESEATTGGGQGE